MHLFGELSVIECAQVKVAPCWFRHLRDLRPYRVLGILGGGPGRDWPFRDSGVPIDDMGRMK
jgi:hypothetical protein